MSFRDEIAAAIAAHGHCKLRLRAAIVSATGDCKPDQVADDHTCEFGKWLYGLDDAHRTASPLYRQCVALHRNFHTHAAAALKMAVDGNRTEAEAAIGPGSAFSQASGLLTRALMEWQERA